MLTMTLKQAFAHKMRFVSTTVAVLLGVTLMAGTLIFTDTLTATFDDVLADAHQGVDVLVRAPSEVALSTGQTGAHIDASTADLVRRVDGVADVATKVTGYAQLVGPNDEPVGDQSQTATFGHNWVEVETLNPYRIANGRAPKGADEVVLDRKTAGMSGYTVGDDATVLSTGDPRVFRVVGIATFASADSSAGANVMLFADDVAQELLATPGQVDGVLVAAAADISIDEVTERIQAAVPDDLEVVTGDVLVTEDQAAFQDSFGPFKVFLLVFAVVAMFVGAFMINNTFSITVAQRTQQLAMLRAVGASRRQVTRSVLGEAVAIGIVGSALGLMSGFGVAIGLGKLLGAVGVELPDAPTVVSTRSMLLSAGIGMAVTFVSAWLPARRAGRVPPIAALRELGVDRSGASTRRIVSGTSISGLGIGALLVGLNGGGIELVGLGALVTIIGIAVLAPVLARPVTRLVSLPLKLRGMPGEMALRNAQRNPKRTARTASSLMIGVALVAFIAILAASVKTSFGGSMETTFHGTHIVDSGAFEGPGGLSSGLADQLQAVLGSDNVVQTRTSPAIVDGADATLMAFSAGALPELFDLGTIEGDLDGLGDGGLAVSAEYAAEQGWTIGTPVEVALPTGHWTLEVGATYDNGSEWVGDYFVDIPTFETALPRQLDFRIYASGDAAAIDAVAASHPSADVLTKDAFVDQSNAEIQQILGVIYAMLALALLMAVLGIANTMALSIKERTRELGLLRAVGMIRAQVRAAVRWEATTIALFGTTLGLTVGTFFGWATVQALEAEGIDTLTMPVGVLAAVTAIAAVAGAVAAVLPARRAARMNVLDALATQ